MARMVVAYTIATMVGLIRQEVTARMVVADAIAAMVGPIM